MPKKITIKLSADELKKKMNLRDGRDGSNGKDGKQGLKGERGEIGLAGEKGDTGLTGASGSDGKDGSPDTRLQIVEKINTGKKDDLKIDVNQIQGLEKMHTDTLNRAISILDQRTKFLINKTNDIATVINFVDDEVASGVIDGVNQIFTLEHIPVSGSLKVYVNGQRVSLTTDYTLVGNTITFIIAPFPGAIIKADYRY